MNDVSDFDDPAFEATLESEMRAAVSTFDPDIEGALRSVRSVDIERSSRRPERLLIVAAAIAIFGIGAIGLSRIGTTSNEVTAGPAGGPTGSIAVPAPLEEVDEGEPATAEADVEPPSPTEEADLTAFGLALHGDGLRAIDPESGESILVPFGSARNDVVDLVVSSYGPPGSENLLGECGGGPLLAIDWGGLALYFDPDAADPATASFLGWVVDDQSPVISTTDGLGFGTPIPMVATRHGEVIVDSTLGWEYFDGAITWVSTGLAGEFVIDVVWAGESCVFR